MKRYKIYIGTQWVDLGLVAEYFEGATVYAARGLWRGTLESCQVIEILTELLDSQLRAISLAEKLKKEYEQESVLVTEEDTPRVCFL